VTGNPSQDGTLLLDERNVLELIATGASLPVVLDALCRVIDEHSRLTSSVYVLDRERRQLRFAAGPRVPDAWRRVTQSFPALPTNAACGSAVNLRHSVVVENIATSPLFLPEWRTTAAAVGIGSAWSTPFFSKDGSVLGTFAVFDRASKAPSREDLRFVERATRLASIIVEWNETETSLRESERRFSTAFYSNPAAMAISRYDDGRFMYVNDRFTTLFGHSRSEAIGKTSLELGLWGQNLLDPRHGEISSQDAGTTTQVPRTFLAKVTKRF
jgi:PAS domain-containing protein